MPRTESVMDFLSSQTSTACFHPILMPSALPVRLSDGHGGIRARSTLLTLSKFSLGWLSGFLFCRPRIREMTQQVSPVFRANLDPLALRCSEDVGIGASVKLAAIERVPECWKRDGSTEELVGYGLLLATVPIVPILLHFECPSAFCFLVMAAWSISGGHHRFSTAAAMLSSLLLNDVVGAFGASSLFGDNVMVSVATSTAVDGPMKLIFPHFKEGAMNPHSIAGLGDIAAPGLLIALMLRFDRSRMKFGLTAAVGKKKMVEDRWRQFFSDPSQWWDHRLGKTSAKYPDFKQKTTGEALWVHDNSNPKWVKAELAGMTPGTVQLPILFWNKKLAQHVRDGQHQKTLELFKRMVQEGRNPDSFTFVPVLKACGNLLALDEGRRLHAWIEQIGLEADLFVGTCLIDMYAKCGSADDARRVFSKMPTRDVMTWTAMIVGFVKCGQGQKALELFELMKLDGVQPVSGTFVGVLNACASLSSLKEGKRVHAHIVQCGCESDPYVGSSLVDMYAKCGSIDEAQRVFNKISTRNVVSWTALIMGYVKCGHGQKALEVYARMKLEQVEPVPLTFVGVLNACASVGILENGRYVHEEILQSGCISDVFVGTSLVDMYAKCRSTEEAQKVFDEMAVRNVVSWNAMLTGYVKCGQGEEALDLYRQMLAEGVEPEPTTFVVVLNACTSLRALEEGRRVHAQIIQNRCKLDVFVGTSLVDMYAKCGRVEDAWSVFSKMPTWDVAAWTAMIMGYVYSGQGKKALALYYQMQLEGFEPAPNAFVGVLRACALESTVGDDGPVI